MSSLIQYDINTGMITATIANQSILPEQEIIDANREKGIGFTLGPDEANGITGMILSGEYAPFKPNPAPLPSPMVQLIAALVNNGLVSDKAFHPSTIATINSQLNAANMTEITAES